MIKKLPVFPFFLFFEIHGMVRTGIYTIDII